MKKIIINEDKKAVLVSAILQESLSDGDESDKVLQIKAYLDKNFSKAADNAIGFDDNGNRNGKSYLALLGNNNDVVKLMTDRQVFELLQERFKSILPNNDGEERKKRDTFLKKVLIAWYNNKITKNGSILS